MKVRIHSNVRDGRDVWEVSAPAKLNLFLELLGPRPDGLHEIETLMTTVEGLDDVLTIAENPTGEIILECDDPSLPTDATNLATRAALALRRATGTSKGATLRLVKSIPAKAGLAGGSSDASAVLLSLNQIWGLNLPGEQLDEIAATIGSDVVFFRHGPTAVCRGRGERVEALKIRDFDGVRPPLWCVLVSPDVGLSTAEVYAGHRTKGPDWSEPRRSIEPMLKAFSRGEPASIGSCLFNRLQSTAEEIAPELVRVRDALAELGPSHLCGSIMSGSGSAYFGLAPDHDAATEAARSLATLGLGRVRVVSCPAAPEIAS